MKIKILLAVVVLTVMFITVTVIQAANNGIVIDDFEGYTAGQPIDGQGGWSAAIPSCNITVENVNGNNILRSNSCTNSQVALKDFSFPFTDQTVYSYVQFKGQLTSGSGANNNSFSLIRLRSLNELITFGIGTNPSAGINYQLMFSSPKTGLLVGPQLIPDTWYNFRLEVDWSYTSDSGGFGLATLSYKEVTETNWLTSPTFSDFELNVVDPTQFFEVRAMLDGFDERRGEMDDITYVAQQPEIAVQGNGQTISNGDTTPSLADDTDFGTTPMGTPIVRTYTIDNSGSFTLTLTSSITAPVGFSASSFGTTQVSPGGTTTVDIQLDALTIGDFSGPVQIASNDLDQTPYTFNIKGEVVAPPPVTSLTIVKEASPADGTDFAFTSTVPGYPDFTLDNEPTQTDSFTASTTFSLAPGTYTVTELLPNGWQLDTASCTGGNTSGNLTGQTLSVAIGAGQQVVCTFVNSQLNGSITVVKEASPADGTDFAFSSTVPGYASFTLDDEPTQTDSFTASTTFSLAPGTYTVTESTPFPASFSLDDISCKEDGVSNTIEDEGNFQAIITLEAGETVQCTFINVHRPPNLVLVKNDGGLTALPGDTIDYSLAYTNLGGTATGVVVTETVPTHTTFNALASTPDWVCLPSNSAGSTCTLAIGTVAESSNDTLTFAVDVDLPLLAGVSLIINSAQIGDDGSNGADPTPNDNLDSEITPVINTSSLTIVKEAYPADGTDFAFSSTVPGYASFTLDDEPTQTDSFNQAITFNDLPPGNYTVTELLPNGWQLDTASCTGGKASLSNETLSIALEADQQVVCTFVNSQLNGSITVVKEASPADGTDFAFSSTVPGYTSFTLDDEPTQTDSFNQAITFNDLPPGNYTVTELLPNGWQLDTASCTGGKASLSNETLSIALEADQQVVCTFVNSQLNGSITIVKEASPADGTDFAFSSTVPGYTSFTLDDEPTQTDSFNQAITFNDLPPGTYTVTELLPNGWQLDTASCTGGKASLSNETLSIALEADQQVVCTFVNSQLNGSITVVKEASPADGTDFAFSSTVPGYASFTLDDEPTQTDSINQAITFNDLPPGTYTVTELLPNGWQLDTVSCTGGSGPGNLTGQTLSIALEADQQVVCTFVNRQLNGSITIVKEASPADGTDFAFSSTVPGYASFTLDDEPTQTDSINQAITFNDLPPGNYTVTELLPNGWQLDTASCTGGKTSLSNETLSVALEADQQVVCTFTNDLVFATISIDGLLDLESIQTTYSSISVPNAPQGTFIVTANFRNISTTTIKNIHFEVTELTRSNLLLNADGGPAGIGATVLVPADFLGTDQQLSPDETFTIVYELGLISRQSFSFFVTAYGIFGNESIIVSSSSNEDNLNFKVIEDNTQANGNYHIYMPLIIK